MTATPTRPRNTDPDEGVKLPKRLRFDHVHHSALYVRTAEELHAERAEMEARAWDIDQCIIQGRPLELIRRPRSAWAKRIRRRV